METVKYLSKYIYKGSDRTTIEISSGVQDKIKAHLDGWFIGPTEACWKIFEFNMHGESPAVQYLPVYLSNEHYVNFHTHQTVNEVLARQNVKKTQYSSFKDPCPKDFTAHYIGLINYLSHFLHPILLFYLSCVFAHLLLCLPHLLPGLFLISLFLFLFLISIIFSFFPIFPNIPYQISCHPIHIVVLLYIFLVILLCDLLPSSSSLFF